MTQILICDNDLDFARQFSEMVQACFPGDCAVSVCGDAHSLLDECARQTPDIVLLDILLGEDNGIELAKRCFPRSSGVSVIFVTGYLEYCTEVYEAEHVYFLPKPVQPDKLRRALEMALAAREDMSCSFSVRVGRATRRIDVRDVLCIESFYRKLRIRLRDEVVECYGTIAALPESVRAQLIHCHKSFLVNPEHVRTMDRQSFLLTNGSTIPISRTRYAKSREDFLAYCGRHLEVH